MPGPKFKVSRKRKARGNLAFQKVSELGIAFFKQQVGWEQNWRRWFLVPTQEQADWLLVRYLGNTAARVSRVLGVSIKQAQFDALVSFAESLVWRRYQGSKVCILARRKPERVGAEICKWNTWPGGLRDPELVRRRQQEARLWEVGYYDRLGNNAQGTGQRDQDGWGSGIEVDVYRGSHGRRRQGQRGSAAGVGEDSRAHENAKSWCDYVRAGHMGLDSRSGLPVEDSTVGAGAC